MSKRTSEPGGQILRFPDRPADGLRRPRSSQAGPLVDIWSSIGARSVLAPSQVLFVAGEPAEHIYVVAEGKLAALCMSAEGHRFVSFEAGPGDVLGEAALLPA